MCADQHDIYVDDVATGQTRDHQRRLRELVSTGLRLGQRRRTGSARLLPLESGWPAHRVLAVRSARRRQLLAARLPRQGTRIVTQIPYPQTGTINPSPLAGTVNSAARAAGYAVWMALTSPPQNLAARLATPRDDSSGPTRAELTVLDRLSAQLDAYLLPSAHGAASARCGVTRTRRSSAVGFRRPSGGGADHGGSEFLGLSEKDGWMHVYRVTRDGARHAGDPRDRRDAPNLRRGRRRQAWLYFIARPRMPRSDTVSLACSTDADPVSVPPERSAAPTPTTSRPTASFAFHGFSSHDDPGLREIIIAARSPARARLPRQRRRCGGRSRPCSIRRSSSFRSMPATAPGSTATRIKPPQFDPSRKYPVLIVHVYGEPAGQTVTGQLGRARTTLFHRYDRQPGYLVVSFDNRGTPAPGPRLAQGDLRLGRRAVLEAAGAGARRARTRPVRSSTCRGSAVWGWSGGGTNTLNLMFRTPSCTRWASRSRRCRTSASTTPFTRNATWACRPTTPRATERARRSTSPRAEGRAAHRARHGDDNVHYQGTEGWSIGSSSSASRSISWVPTGSHALHLAKAGTFPLHVYQLITRCSKSTYSPALTNFRRLGDFQVVTVRLADHILTHAPGLFRKLFDYCRPTPSG